MYDAAEDEEPVTPKESTDDGHLRSEKSSDIDSEDRHEMHIEKLLRKIGHHKDYVKLDQQSNSIRKIINAHLCQEDCPEKDDIELRLEKSMNELEELIRVGQNITTNVKTVCRKRELLMKTDYNQRLSELHKNFELDSVESKAKLKEIESKWSELEATNNYAELFSNLHNYRELMENVLSDKDILINKCKAEVERVNSFYEFDNQKQFHEFACMQDRFDAQMDLLNRSYREHMDLLHRVFVDEREHILSNLVEKFNFNMKNLDSLKEKLLAVTHEKAKMFSKSFKRICLREQELTEKVIKESGLEGIKLQLELRKTKLKTLMESEINDYNYFILQRKSTESYFMNNQQSLRITKINDAIFQLRERIGVQKKNNQIKIQTRNKHLEILHAHLTRYELNRTFARQSNNAMFKKMWTFNLREIRPLLTKLIEIDRLVHEHQLGVKYIPPKLDDKHRSFYEDGNLKDPKRSVSKRRTSTNKYENRDLGKKEKRFLRNVIRLIGDRSGGLISEKFHSLMSFEEADNKLIKINNIFDALRITELKEIESLVDIFRAYSWCPNCSKGLPQETLNRLYKIVENDRKLPEPAFVKKVPANNKKCSNHYLVTEPMFAFISLRDFVERRNQPKHIEHTDDIPKTEEIINFWQDLSSYMPVQKLELWNGLRHAMDHYYMNLKERDQLNRECVQLQKQNDELQYLMQQY